jgi:protocatechuate 3,4-dioxygenase beta subunit
MNDERRRFLQSAALAVAGSGLVLRADALPTSAVELEKGTAPPVMPPAGFRPTTTQVEGPFYRPGAPYRAKTTPPFEKGTVMVFSGRVWGFETKRPLPGATLEVWHVDVDGHYSEGDGDFRNRARLVSSETGEYEIEMIRPVAYKPGPNFWRCAHLHLALSAPGYRRLTTEIYFPGDPHQATDSLFSPSRLAPVVKKTANGQPYEAATFDLVLEAGS